MSESTPEQLNHPLAKHYWWPSMAQMGMIGWIASLVVFFAALILAFAVTLHGVEWADPIRVPVALWVSTVLLIASAVTLAASRFQLRRARISSYRQFLWITAFLGFAFVISQLVGAKALFDGGIYTQANPRGSAFYAFTGIHGLHLIGGIGALIYLLRGSTNLFEVGEQPLRKARLRAQISAWYWNFVFISWLVLFAFLLRWAG